MINLTIKATWVYFDNFGMPVVKNDAKSINDSVGRLVLMGITYGFIPEIRKALENCLNETGAKAVLYRHPTNKVPTSRDHTSYFYIYRKYTRQELPDFPKMRGMALWMKALTGNKRAEFFYYFWAIPGAYIGNGFLRFCRWAGDIVPEMDNDWWIGKQVVNGHYLQTYRTHRQRLWAWIIFQTIPAYALHIKAWQIFVMRESRRKDKLKRILLKRVGKSNIMLRLLLASTKTPNSEDSVTQEEIDNYPHMTNFRPGVYLDESCKRDIREMTPEESEFNFYEKSLIKKLYDDTIV